jgi:ribose transport system ATP-binding protein
MAELIGAKVEPAAGLIMRGVHKRFGAVHALEGVDLRVEHGEVHALIGENGAGKSTLMKILAGVVAPDSGSMLLEGQPYSPADPLAARRHGVAMIHQELSLAKHLSVQANIMLGRELHSFGVLSGRQMREKVSAALALLGHPEITPERRLGELGPGARQLVEIARALVSDARLIVMDEPTSSLAHGDVERLFAVLPRLRARHVSIIYISHALEELERIADGYTVLRDGQSVQTGRVRETTRGAIVEAMVGRPLAAAFPRIEHPIGEPILELRELAGKPLPHAASLTLRRGEVLGIAGLAGAGRSELLRALFGLAAVQSGTITLAGTSDHGRAPWIRIAQGVAMLSEQRKEEGLALGSSVTDNLTLPALRSFARLGFIRRAEQRTAARHYLDRLAVRCDDPARAVGTLSGGNQQKVALARLLCCDAQVLLLDEPTRGIDVGSKAEIYRAIGELAHTGKAVLWVSSYLPELLGVCDRIAVMHRGRLGPARPASELSEAALMREATGAA